MCIIAKRREISSDEALSPLKPYIKSILPAVVLKALTVGNSSFDGLFIILSELSEGGNFSSACR